MSNLKVTSNHPIKKRKILGPIGRFVLKLINWKIVGNLPDKKRIIIASAPHSSTFDSIYAFFVCLAIDLKFYFLGSVSMFTRIVVPLPFKKNPDKLGIPHPFGKFQNRLLLEFCGIPVWRTKSTGVTRQVIEQLKTKDNSFLNKQMKRAIKASTKEATKRSNQENFNRENHVPFSKQEVECSCGKKQRRDKLKDKGASGLCNKC